MALKLTANQCRIIGVLLEKETTTPDQYPLSLNGLTNACNQKSNREPVLNLSESEVQNVLDELSSMNLVSDQGAFSGRVAKYQHRFCNTEFGDIQLTPQQRAIICVMLLRGPQTPGELRTRTNRLAEFANVSEVETVLNTLQFGEGTTFVVKMEREPGKRESRFAHLFSDAISIEGDAVKQQSSAAEGNAFSHQRQQNHHAEQSTLNCAKCVALEERVVVLEQEMANLKNKLEDLL